MGRESPGTTLEVGPEELNAEIAELNVLIENKKEEWKKLEEQKGKLEFRRGREQAMSNIKDPKHEVIVKMDNIQKEIRNLRERKEALEELTLRPK